MFFKDKSEAVTIALKADLHQAREFILSKEFRRKPVALVTQLQLQLAEYRALEIRQRLHVEVLAHAEPHLMQKHFAKHTQADEQVVIL